MASTGDYYYNAGRRVPVRVSSSRVAAILPENAAKAAVLDVAASLESTVSVASTRAIGASGIIEVTVNTASAMSSERSALDAAISEIERAGAIPAPVFVEPGIERDASTLFVRTDILARFSDDVSAGEAVALAAAAGLTLLEPLAYAPNGYRLGVASPTYGNSALEASVRLFETGRCVFAHPNFLAHRVPRFTPDDPEFENQWHLKNTGQGGGQSGADVRAEAAWDLTQGDPSIIVAVADTGIDTAHPDLDVSIDGVPKIVAPRDVVHGDDDPSPKSGDASVSHGTAAAGVAIAAFNNGRETAGIAPKCRLMPIQLYAESTFTPNSTEADAFTWAADHGAAVMSNSWGPDNDFTPLPDATRAAIDHATTTGRGGLGMVIFFAAGNSSDDTDRDNYVSYAGVVGVAASTNFDTRAGYSRFGRAVSIAAPSSGGSLGITTTDLTGPGGYSSGNFTANFGGTSSACPLAAGTAALVLSANPELSWTEVKQILEDTADKIDPAGGAYDGSGFSIFYGHGRVNAEAAVQAALDLANSDNPRVTVAMPANPGGAGAAFQINWTAIAQATIASQQLSYSTDGGATFDLIASVDSAARSYAWTIPDDVAGAVRIRVAATDVSDRSGAGTITVTVWAKPSVQAVKVKRTASGKLSITVDGAAFRVDQAVIFVGDTPLGSLKYPKGRRNADGTCTRIVSKDAAIGSLVPNGVQVQITVQHALTGQVSAAVAFTR